MKTACFTEDRSEIHGHHFFEPRDRGFKSHFDEEIGGVKKAGDALRAFWNAERWL